MPTPVKLVQVRLIENTTMHSRPYQRSWSILSVNFSKRLWQSTVIAKGLKVRLSFSGADGGVIGWSYKGKPVIFLHRDGKCYTFANKNMDDAGYTACRLASVIHYHPALGKAHWGHWKQLGALST